MHYIRTYNFKCIMKSLLFGIASLAVAQARFFKGKGILGASSDFQGNAHEQHEYKGTVYHHDSATPATEASTIEHITTDIAQMFAQKLPGLFAEMQENMETQADTGFLFCGAKAAINGQGVSDLGYDQGNQYWIKHDFSDSPVSLDGIFAGEAGHFGVGISEAASLGQCGDNKCLPESLVAKLAGLIRAHGYHVKHSDICTAYGQRNYDIRFCNNGPGYAFKKLYSCPRSVAPQYEQDERCSGLDNMACWNSNTCENKGNGCRAKFESLEDQGCVENTGNSIGWSLPPEGFCRECHSFSDDFPDCPDNVQECCPGTNGGKLDQRVIDGLDLTFGVLQRGYADIRGGEGIVPNVNICSGFFTTNGWGGLLFGGAASNQVSRVIQYGIANGVATNIPDSVAITGSFSGCETLRGNVLAINGNKIELRFIAKQHRAAEDYWQSQIDDTKAIIKTVREKIHNLQGLGNYFYPLENSKRFQCNAEFSAFEPNIDAGGPEDPKCDLSGTDYAAYQGMPHYKSMAQRTSCFCRSFAGSGDDFYLSTTLADKAYCDANMKDRLPSVYTFCLQHADLGETEEWKRALDELLFSPNDVPTNLDTWFPGASDEIKKNFEDSLAGQGRTCGRVASADPNNVKFSNKGGNCVPIEGVQDIIYRLEFEFFNADAAVDQKNEQGNTYGDSMCVANPGGDQILSFRQLAYVWQRRNPNVAGALFMEDDLNLDTLEGAWPKAQMYLDITNTIDYENFCTVDYTQLLGGGKAYVEGTTMVADPLDFLVRVTGEASYNVERTQNARAIASAEEEVLWNRITQTLTETKKITNLETSTDIRKHQKTYNNIVNSIGEKAAGHFMAILGHNGDETGFTPLCGKRVEMSEITSTNGISKCEEALELHVTNDGDVNVGSFAAFNAPNLRKTVLSSGTGKYDIKAMAFRGNSQYKALENLGIQHTILFKSEKYSPTGTGITVTMTANSIDVGKTRCGLLCDEGYFDNATEYYDERAHSETMIGARAPICDIDNLEELGNRYCELDRRIYQVASPREYPDEVLNNKFDDMIKFGFYSRQITRDTKFDCALATREIFRREPPTRENMGNRNPSLNALYNTSNSVTDPTITIAEFYLGTDCATLEIGDLSQCPYLEQIYIHTQTDYVVDGPNTAAAASCANKVDFSNAKFGDKQRFVWTGDAAATAAARAADVPDKSFIFFGAGSDITDANGVSVATDGEYCAKKNGTTASTRGDEVYLVAGDSVKTRFTKQCSFAEKLVLPDSIPRLGDSAILDLDIDDSIVGNLTYQNGEWYTGDRPFTIFVGEKLLDATTETGGRIPDIDNFALFIDDDRVATLRRRCPTLTFDRDEGTRRTMFIPRIPYANGAEELSTFPIPFEYSTPGLIPMPYQQYGYGNVLYGKDVMETSEVSTLESRSINLDRAYDGMTGSRGHQTCTTMVQKQMYVANKQTKTCAERRAKTDCIGGVNAYCPGEGFPRPAMTDCHRQYDQESPDIGYVDLDFGIVFGGDVKMTCHDGRNMILTKNAANLALHKACRGDSTAACEMTELETALSDVFTYERSTMVNGVLTTTTETGSSWNYWPLDVDSTATKCNQNGQAAYGPTAVSLPFVANGNKTAQENCWSGAHAVANNLVVTDDPADIVGCVGLCGGDQQRTMDGGWCNQREGGDINSNEPWFQPSGLWCEPPDCNDYTGISYSCGASDETAFCDTWRAANPAYAAAIAANTIYI